MPTRTDVTVVNQAYDTSGNGGRKLVRLSNGWLVAGMKNGTTGVKFYKSSDNGQTWSLLATSTESNPSLSMVAKGTDIYVLLAYSTVVRSYKIDGLTGRESSYRSVDSGQNSVGECSLTINEDGTELHAAWASKNSTYSYSFNIRYAKGTINADGSVTWGAVEQVSQANLSGNDFINPTIYLTKNNNPSVICAVGSASTPTMILNITKEFTTKDFTSFSFASGWGNKIVYNSANSSYPQKNPSACVAPNGRIWVAWHGSNATYSPVDNIFVSYSDDGGITWSPIIYVTTPTSVTSHYQFASITVNKNNEIFIVCRNGSSGVGWDLVYFKYNGSTWTQTVLKDANVTAGAEPLSPSALYDITLDFSVPLVIYQDTSKIGFYGTWTVTTISVTPGYIGQKTSADKSNILTYSITTDGTMGTITEKINGTTIATRTNPTSGQQFTVSLSQAQWDAIKYGNAHTLTITMGGDTWTYTFDKRLNVNDDILSAVKGVQDLQDHLNGIKAQLAAAIRTKGGTVNDTDAWSAFVSAVVNMMNKRWATGTATSTSSYQNFQYAGSTATVTMPFVTVTGLTFKPSLILIVGSQSLSIYSEINDAYYQKAVKVVSYGSTSSGASNYNIKGDVSPASVTSTGFTLPVYTGDTTYTWLAIE